MGDRAVVVFKDEDEYSSCIYLHWDGSNVMDFLEKASPRLRSGDIQYTAARFVGVCHESIEGNLSLGIMNMRDEDDLESIDPGDNGVWVVDVRDWTVDHYLRGYFVKTIQMEKELITA
jgi:DNA topoisomerase VI subunit A